MTSLNGNANTMQASVGMFGGGGTAGTGASAGGFESVQPDNFQFAYTATSASPAVFTSASAVTNEGAFVNTSSTNLAIGDVVTLGFVAGPFTYTATSASPAVFTSVEAGTNGLHITDLIANGMGVILVGTSPGGFTSSVFSWSQGNPYNGVTPSITQYYMVAISGNTFELSATQGGSAINSTSAIAAPMTDGSVFYIYGGAPTGFTPGHPYYVVAQSGNTFELAATQGGSAINSSTIGGGVMQLQRQMTVAPQISYAAGTSYQMYKQGGWRTGLQPGQVASATSLSLDEDPQLMWQNVPGATCQTSYATGIGGASGGAGGVQITGATYNGWGAKGGISVASGGAGQTVYELKMHKDDNGGYETTAERKARLGSELDGLKAKAAPTAKDNARKAVVEAALKELK